MAIHSTLKACLQEQLSVVENEKVNISSITPVSGGSINDSYRIQTSANQYMVKVNSRSAYPNMFKLEAKGLGLIKFTQAIATPDVICCGDAEDQSFLVLEWIDKSKPNPASFTKLGEQLAAMHRHTDRHFGLWYNNYMGSLPQSNRQHSTWNSFFVEERLMPMVHIAQSKNLLTAADVSGFETLYYKLPGLFNEEKPSLLHGDLWGGNYLIGPEGKLYLIDPAVSYGNREFDIAMTTLFGGFGNEFYDAYNNAFPLHPSWQQRLDLWNLYPLLLHLNLFGAGYLTQVRSALSKYL